jgi:C4-dicarboxylate-specific signal transduction histidine kinase
VKTHGREPHPALHQRFTVRSVVEETRALLTQRLRLECCELTLAEHPEGVSLVGDPARLGQILVNLVTNALDAYEEAHLEESRIIVTARATATGVEIGVRDWARGMPAEVAARIFDELFTTKDPGRGTGLGLCIARNLVENSFGGTLTVESEVGVGTRFVIGVPVSRADHSGEQLVEVQ